ncbi:MAG: asparagine synthase (glutamine-hydrolyzing) [Firmicutes bacterium]|nr:asparagine synthase (glutamine-hydrolyzing) [Bacillota bacterium]
MCGIAGAINFTERPKIEECLSGMFGTMKRRGPDASGIDISDSGILLHTRLVVIDPENGRQPMHLDRNGEKFTIVYNGELYNTEEIRSQLSSLGETFRGYSDTEVLLKAYVRWGPACLSRLNGIFAFAVLHKNERKLFIARDRMGVKPLFYTQVDDTFIFSSEIKTILKYPDIKPVIDKEGITEILLIGPGRTPGCGVFKGIKELRPGEYGILNEKGLKITRYWQLKDEIHTDSLEDTIEKVKTLVTDSIKRQLVSDVPIGTFLSGGLDSSVISAVAANYFKNQGRRLSTFSVTYQDNRKYFQTTRFQPTTDDDYIHQMVIHLKSDHHSVTIDNESLAHALYAAVDARDLPGMGDVDASLLLFCQEIKQHVTVALSGECADEIFGGYPWFRDEKIRSAYGFPWAQTTDMRSSFLAPDLRARLNFDPHKEINNRYEKTISETDKVPKISKKEGRLREMVRLNSDWFMQTLLDRKDRMAMYSGLEVRVPFCDHRLAEYMYSVPWEMKELGGMEKGLLREAVKGLIPEEIRLRKKSPYPKTHNPGYRTIVSGMLEDIIAKPDAPIFQLIDKKALRLLLDSESPEPWYGQLMTAPQTIAYMIQLNYWLEKYRVKIDL